MDCQYKRGIIVPTHANFINNQPIDYQLDAAQFLRALILIACVILIIRLANLMRFSLVYQMWHITDVSAISLDN